MSKPKKLDKKRGGKGREPGKFLKFPSEVDILLAVMKKNLKIMRNTCRRNSGVYSLAIYAIN